MAHETHNLNVSLLKSIGEISDKKVKQISASGFDLTQQVNGVMAQFIEKKSGIVLMVAQNQITLAAGASVADRLLDNPSIAIETFDKILDILLLDRDSAIQIKLERSYHSETNTLEKAKNFLASDEVLFEGATSVGFRIPFKRAEFGGEIKIEPFFNNAQRYFLDCVIQSESSSVDSFKKISEAIKYEFEPLAHKLFR